ncbi:hypothetical protein FisN_18Lh084 [Fistulifera solaris]|uniref:Succinate dehydrogenase (Ubiquinone) cytochrome b560 subunit n=1 Tax=Fistulifera solaris TaxID=1519565 RepID=A0A1Z5KDY6_FISSO|nr:hypothetical protein FisN_18Lh084 [Fistulifera solaris]|eukprot:GAX24530.1 hypothetical protein FisN_18Lh084 [Fistulifera solaris]
MNALNATSSSKMLQKFTQNNVLRSQMMRSMTILSKQSGEEYKQLNYSKRMKEMGRPVSPHVTVYAFPTVALSSITNRVTGCALSVGCAGLGLVELVGGTGTSLSLMQTIGSQGLVVAAAAKFAVSFPIVYHYFAAIRHFMWDAKPEMLENQAVQQSSYYLFGASAAISGALIFI